MVHPSLLAKIVLPTLPLLGECLSDSERFQDSRG
jgi:hypothetical protein